MVQKQVISGGTVTSVRRIQGLGFPARDWSFVHFLRRVGFTFMELLYSVPGWIAIWIIFISELLN